MLGVTCRKEAEPEPVVFWDEHRSAIEWWLQVQDLLRWQGPVCEGLDVNAVKADAEMSGRTINADDYHRLKLISHTVKTLFNDRLKH